MAVKNISVNLTFNANTQAAKAQLQSLQNLLSNIAATGAGHPLALTPEIQQATQAALNLKIALQNATNVNTGKLDLSKFQSKLKQSKMSIEQYAAALTRLGPQGVQAFNQIAQAVATAERPIFRLSASMQKLGQTLMNTVRWSLSSAAIQAVTTAVSETVSYAKELDTSLNNIRIVTGKGANEMARFAQEANKMAKQLSTTTTAYTDASLIYYQQGLDKAAVKERTDTTIKLANVVGENAETVSEWMTAIWNNFDNGTKSLESYADILAKLGAVTASSADEIAGGLEKFASIANTVGLSYEYAASALATITAETRQSEDVVGTALKTIFSRMENLSLGETLDDGTTLGKYSEALKTVGVNIKDANGNLKDMDVILQQTGERWQTLNRDNQVALAQSVAGIRQYAQFMALMDNWNVMERNLELAKESTGELETQNAIYEQSAEAAEKRMTSSAEKIMQNLFDGESLKEFYDGLSGILDFVDKLVDAFGGFQGLLVITSGVLLKMISPHLVSGLESIKLTAASIWSSLTGRGKNEDPFITKTLKAAKTMNLSSDTATSSMQNDILTQSALIRQKMLENDKLLTAEQKQQLEFQIQLVDAAGQEALKTAEELEKLQNKTKEMREQAKLSDIIKQGMSIQQWRAEDRAQNVEDSATNYGRAKTEAGRIENLAKSIAITEGPVDRRTQSKVMRSELDAMSNINNTVDRSTVDTAVEKYENGEITRQQVADALRKFAQDVVNASQQAYDTAVMDATNDANQKARGNITRASNEIDRLDQELHGDKDAQGNRITGSGLYAERGRAKATDTRLQKEMVELEKEEVKYQSTPKSKRTKAQKQAKEERDARKAALQDEIKTNKKSLQNYDKTIAAKEAKQQELTKSIQETEKAMGDTEKQIKQNGEEMVTLGEKTEEAAGKQRDFNNQSDGIGDNINAMASWKNNIEGVVSTLSSLAMGLSMCISGAQSFGDAIREDNATFADFISSFSSFAMGAMMLIGPLFQIIEAFQKMRVATAADTAEKTKNTIISKIFSVAKKKEGQAVKQAAQDQIAANKSDDASEAAEMAENLGGWISKGPVGWIVAAISAAAIAAFVGASLLASIPSAADYEEQRQEDIETDQENISVLKGTSESIDNASDLIDKLKELQATGENTKDAIEDLKEQLPELALEFKKTENALAIDLKTSDFDILVQYYKETGQGLELIEKHIDNINKKIAKQTEVTARSALETNFESMLYALNKADGTYNENTQVYTQNLWGKRNDQGRSIVAEYLKKEGLATLGSGDNDDILVNFKISSTDDIIKYYETLQKAKIEMESVLTEEAKEDSEVYDRVKKELETLAETYQKYTELADEYYLAVVENFNKGESIKLREQFFKESEISLSNYEAKREKIIAQIMKDNSQLSREQAEMLLSQSQEFKKLEIGIELFDKEGVIAQQLGDRLFQVKQYYDSLPDSLKSYAIGINYELINTPEDFFDEIQKAYEQHQISLARTEAESLGADIDIFKTYAESLEKTNVYLTDNEVAANQVAVANIRVNKGLESLNKTWEKSLSKIKESSKGTYEYAEGIGEIRKSLTEMFGVEPNTEFIEAHLEDIQSILSGNLEAFETLQTEIAQEYVDTIYISPKVVFDGNKNAIIQDVETIRSALQGAIDELGDLEVGEQVTLSDKYLATLQKALDAGQLTKEQLEEAFSLRGYDLKFDTQQIPGPTTTKTISGKGPFGLDWSTQYTEQTMIDVPLLQGGDVSITGGNSTGNVTARRVVDNTSLNLSAIEENKNTKVKDVTKDLDRYYTINEALEDLENNLDKISKAKDRAFGADRIKYIQAEQKALEAEYKAQKMYLDQIQAWKKYDENKLKNEFGAEIDKESGRVLNYEEMFMIERDKIMAARTSALSEVEKDKAEQRWSNFTSYLSQYTETLNLEEDTLAKLEENKIEQFEKRLEEIDSSIEIDIELNERQIKNLERELKQLTNDLTDAPRRINKIVRQIEENFESIDSYETGIRNTLATIEGIKDEDIESFIKGNAEALKDYTIDSQTLESLQEYIDGITDSQDAIIELRKEIDTQVMDTFKAWREEIEKTGETFENFKSIIGSYKDIIDIVGKDRLGLSDALLKDLNALTDEASFNSFNSTLIQLETTRRNLKELEQSNEDKESDSYKEKMKALTEALEADTVSAATAWSDYISSITDTFEDNITIILDTFSDVLAGTQFKSLEALSEAFNREREITDLYLADYKKIYELSKLNRNIAKSMDATDNIKAQKILRELQEEVAYYQTVGKEMSQYELEALQKKYDLRLAEIALEEAQNAKNQVRLTQDSSGNWGYVYTANETNIADSTQKYEDALYASQELGHQYINDLQSNIIQNRQELVDALAVIKQNEYATDEEQLQAWEDTVAHYVQKERHYLSQLGIALDDWELDFADTQLAIQTGYKSIEDFAAGLTASIGSPDDEESILGQMAKAYVDWKDQVNEAIQLAMDKLGEYKTTSDSVFGDGEKGAQTTIKNFAAFLNAMIYGEGGSKDKISGGIAGALKDTSNKLVQVGEDAQAGFKAAQDKAASYLPKLDKQIDTSEGKVSALNDALAKLMETKSFTTTITIEADTTTAMQDVKDLIREIERSQQKPLLYLEDLEQQKIEEEARQKEEAEKQDKNRVKQIENYLEIEQNDKTWNKDLADTFKTMTGQTASSSQEALDWIDKYGYQKINIGYFENRDGIIYGHQFNDSRRGTPTYTIAQLEENQAAQLKDGDETYVKRWKVSEDEVSRHDKDDIQGMRPIAQNISKENISKIQNYKYMVRLNTKEEEQLDLANNKETKKELMHNWYHNSNLHTKFNNYVLIGEYWYNSEDFNYNRESVGGRLTDLLSVTIPANAQAYLPTYDTGGYTGVWGPEGRLAMLHQKEIVLNAYDTENLLHAVEIVRALNDKLEQNVRFASQGLGSINSAYKLSLQNAGLAQEVTIYADFPNVNDHNEIEIAFNDLINQATQRANRK